MSAEVLIVGAVAALLGLGIWTAWRLEKRRTEQCQAACTAMGFRWLGEANVITQPAPPLFDQGHSRRAKNAMDGETAGHRVVLMDYTYVTGSGKSRTEHKQTVVLFPASARGLPDFTLAPESFFHRIGQVFGYQDIDFAEDAAFSGAYLLRGEDEPAIRAAFHATVRSLLAGNPGWTVQTKQGAAVLCRAGKRCKPPELPAFLAEALRVLASLSPRAPS